MASKSSGLKKRPHPSTAQKAQGASRRTSTGAAGATSWNPVAGEVGIRVRMYRVGFGDFFLISFLNDAGSPAHVIIDCGVFKGTSQTGDIHSIEAAVADMVKTTESEVALIIVTHRHADHIAGFARCPDDFKSLTVGGVWMPIWESEYDSTALKFQSELTSAALTLQGHFSLLGAKASEEQDTARKFMENATGVDAGAAAGATAKGSNAAALALLKNGLKGVVAAEYYKSGDSPKLPKALQDIGLAAQILGPPPISDILLMKLMDLKKGVGQYLTDANVVADEAPAPFSPEWEVDPFPQAAEDETACYSPETLKEWVLPRAWKGTAVEGARTARPVMEAALQRCQPIASLTAAKQLNTFLNNQSLVVLFTFKGKKLLFVGDAQAGNWEHWLFETNTPDQLASGAMSARAQEILTSIDFYKVGHHGSSNATPRIVAQTITEHGRGPACMCSTEKDVYGTEDPDDPTKGTEVPRIPLLDELGSASSLVRSDQIDITVAGKKIAAQVPKDLPAAAHGRRYVSGPMWIDCFL